MFEQLKNKWELHFITIDTLRKWVVINSRNPRLGITAEQFTEITGEDYE